MQTNPAVPSRQMLRPSAAFRKEASKAVLAIVLFFIVYVLLITAAALLCAGCVYGGFIILTFDLHWLTILLGIGLMAVGVLVFFFLVKFIFDVEKENAEHDMILDKDEEPELFAFIQDTAREAGAAKPKKIVLNNDVNASVFYNSSFLSMFLPIRKNLRIGLALMQSMNLSEFRAVLAHEFGHFNQRSMKVGSFVYTVNKIIFNMLFRNNSYSSVLQGFASIHGFFAVFAQITAGVVRSIQWILRQMYKVVNIRYMALRGRWNSRLIM